MNYDDMDKKLQDFFSKEFLPSEELLTHTKTGIFRGYKRKEKRLAGIVLFMSLICIIIQTCIISVLFSVPAGFISLYIQIFILSGGLSWVLLHNLPQRRALV